MKKINRFLPHNFFTLGVLSWVFRIILYILFFIFIYSVYNALSVFLTPEQELAAYSAPLKKIWLTILAQEAILFIVLSLLQKVCLALNAIQKRELRYKN